MSVNRFKLYQNRTVNCIKTGRLAETGNQDLNQTAD